MVMDAFRELGLQYADGLLFIFFLILVNGSEVPHCSSRLANLLEAWTSNVLPGIRSHLFIVVVLLVLGASGLTTGEWVVVAAGEMRRGVHMEELVLADLADLRVDGEAFLAGVGVFRGGDEGFIEGIASRKLRLTSALHCIYKVNTPNHLIYKLKLSTISISPP